MKLLDLVKRKDSVVGATSGDRINAAINAEKRKKAGLPPKREARLIDTDGTVHSHVVDVHRNGKPHKSISVKNYTNRDVPEVKEYEYFQRKEGRLLYKQV